MKWQTETRKVADLSSWEDNPRTITDKSLDELVSSIDELGNFEPLVIDIDGTVIAGNQRLKVAQRLGQEEVEVSVPDRKLTDKEIKKIGVISNRHSGDWDMEKLLDFGDILEELGADDLVLDNYSDKNKEVNLDDFGDEYSVKLKYSEEEYNEVLSLLAVACSKFGQATNEQTILHLLRNA
jgi:hypothetical protein